MLAFIRGTLAYVSGVLESRRRLGGVCTRYRGGLPRFRRSLTPFCLRNFRTQPIRTAEVEDAPPDDGRNAIPDRRCGRGYARQREYGEDQGQHYDRDGP
jgi:hypothetical protein